MLLGVLIHFAIDQHQGECKEKQKTAGFCGHDPLVGIPNVVRRSRKKCIDIYKLSGISMSVCIGLRISLQEIVVFTQKYRCASSQPNLGHSMIIMIISSCLVDFIDVISSLGYSTKWTFKIVNLI
jgi:hypothetical protein